MENIEIRDFSTGVETKPRYSPDEPEVFEVHYGTPKRGLATARIQTTLTGLRIAIAVVYPKPKKGESCQTLTQRESEDITQAIQDLLNSFVKDTLGKDSPAR